MQFAFSILPLPEFHLCLWLHPKDDPAQEDWLSAMRRVEAAKASGVPAHLLRMFVISDGGAPNLTQRRLLTVAYESKAVRSAVVTPVLSNPIKRGIATAITWTNPQFAFYRPEQVHEALAHVEVTRHARRIWTEFQVMQKGLPDIETLEVTRKALDL